MAEHSSGIVTRYYEAFNRADAEDMLACLTEDVAHDVNQGPREIGKDAFRAFMARMAVSYSERLEDVVVMVSDDGTRAAAEFTVHGTYLATDGDLPEARGQTYVLRGGAFFALRAGRLARVTNYYDLNEWLRQIG
jgi:steroid delta-isomerase-like uncharacterized protein